MAGATLLPPHGEQLLQLVVAGAGRTLRQLNLSSMQGFSGNLAMLASCTALTRLDLAATPVQDHHLSDLALLPLAWLSLAGSAAVGDDGVAQLMAAPLEHLDLR